MNHILYPQEYDSFYRAPTPVSFPVNQPKGVFIFPLREPSPPPPKDSRFDDTKESFRALAASWTEEQKKNRNFSDE